jgi:chromosome segregation ATPase
MPQFLWMQVEQDLAAALLDCTQLKQQLGALQQEQGQQASAQEQQLLGQVEALQQQHVQQALELQQQNESEAVLQQQVQQAAQDVAQLQAQLAQVQEQLQQQVQSATDEASHLRAQLQHAEAVLQDHKQRMHAPTATHRDEQGSTGSQPEDMQQQLVELQQSLVDADQEQHGLQEQLTRAQARAKRAEAQINRLLQVRYVVTQTSIACSTSASCQAVYCSSGMCAGEHFVLHCLSRAVQCNLDDQLCTFSAAQHDCSHMCAGDEAAVC